MKCILAAVIDTTHIHTDTAVNMQIIRFFNMSTTEPATVTITSSVLIEPERVTTTSTVTVTTTLSPVVVTRFVTETVRPPSASPDLSGE